MTAMTAVSVATSGSVHAAVGNPRDAVVVGIASPRAPAGEHTQVMAGMVNPAARLRADPEDPLRVTNQTRDLGLIVRAASRLSCNEPAPVAATPHTIASSNACDSPVSRCLPLCSDGSHAQTGCVVLWLRNPRIRNELVMDGKCVASRVMRKMTRS